MRVEPGGIGDLDAMLALERGAEGAPHWREAVYRELLGGSGTEGREWRVVVARGEAEAVVGFAVATTVRAAGMAELESVVVAEGMRRRGLGRQLCAAAVAWAREVGAEAIDLEVWEGNVGAVGLYEGMGFTEVGRRRGYYGEGRDARVMRLELRRRGAGAASP